MGDIDKVEWLWCFGGRALVAIGVGSKQGGFRNRIRMGRGHFSVLGLYLKGSKLGSEK